jgi:hypothetical protein
MRRMSLCLLFVPVLATGCYTNVLAPGAKGKVVDAESGRVVQAAQITRPFTTGGLQGDAPLAPAEGLPSTTVATDKSGRFDLPPATHTDLFLRIQNPESITGSFRVTAKGYLTNNLQGVATSRSLWRVELGTVTLQRQ